MDPALWELFAEGDSLDEVAAIVRLGRPGAEPEGIRLVARFGEIATCRLPRGAIPAVRADEAVASFKAPHPGLAPDDEPESDDEGAEGLSVAVRDTDQRRPPGEPATGRGVVIGVVDWGCDFAHPDFREADGSTRLLALWDQRDDHGPGAPNSYGYGTIHTPAAINLALASPDPYAALRYHPADADPDGSGAHGTHVMGIAAGNGQAGGPQGLAPEAHLVFVHLSTTGRRGGDRLGDSVTLLEAVDFIRRTAGDRPWVINLSMGRHGEQHDGTTLVEQALDSLLRERPNQAICLSAGNYYSRLHHTAGQLRPGETRTLLWLIAEGDTTPNELQVWYSFRDELTVAIRSPDGTAGAQVALGEQAVIDQDGRPIGRIYHRASEPNTLDHQVDIFLDAGAPAGPWELTLIARDVVDGRYHAWIERDAACPGCQSRFAQDEAVLLSTTGSICNGARTLAAGAYNPHSDDAELGPFSSSGPTRDGRVKPDLCAPGVRILSARSAPRDTGRPAPLYIRRSGTSMASPHVAGTVALLFEAAARPLRIEETHNLLLTSSRRVDSDGEAAHRVGSGYLDTGRAVAAARRIGSYYGHGLPAEQAAATRRTAMNESLLLTETISVGQMNLDGAGSPISVEPVTTVPDHSPAGLDDALRWAFAHAATPLLIEGNILGSTRFDVRRFNPVPQLPAQFPSVIEFQGSHDVCALVMPGGDVVYFPSDPTAYPRRWVAIRGLRAFYALPAADQDWQRAQWLRGIGSAQPGTLQNLSTPALRLLVAHHAATAVPIRRLQTGAETRGLTVPLLTSPLSEPDCYLPVIAAREGKVEAINAWDQGAGISIGPIQFNAQRGAMLRFLSRLAGQDPQLFAQEFGTPLTWAMQQHDGHPDLVIGPITLHGTADGPAVARTIRYLKAGDPDQGAGNVAFRRSLAERFRNVVVWPHVQDLIQETTAWWLAPGLRKLDQAGYPRLDPQRPDRDWFTIKALLLSAYVRASSSLDHLIRALRGHTTARAKLEHLQEAVASWDSAHSDYTLRDRLTAQRTTAGTVHAAAERLLGVRQVAEDHGVDEALDEDLADGYPANEYADDEAAAGCMDGESDEDSYVEDELQEDDPQAATPDIDMTVAVPPFTAAKRSEISAPLLTARQSADAIAWNQRQHPASGVALADIRTALANYVDLAAVRQALDAYNTANPSQAIAPGAAPGDAVFVEAVHQFQAKCFAERARRDGKAGRETLDSLGFTRRRGLASTWATNATAAAFMGRNGQAIRTQTNGESEPDNWFKQLYNPSFLGWTCGTGYGIHLILLRRLRIVERQLLGQPAYAGMTPVELGRALGIDQRHGGVRRDGLSMHTFGLAIDIGYTHNPWIAGQHVQKDQNQRITEAGEWTQRSNANFTRAMSNAARLISGLDITLTPAYLAALTRRPTPEIVRVLKERSRELREYLALTPTAIQARVAQHQTAGTAGIVQPGETAAAAAARWQAAVAQDLSDLQHGNFAPHHDPLRGFIDLDDNLVVALRDVARLAWGAVDFGAENGDVMHFDCRTDGIGCFLYQTRVGGRPDRCLPSPAEADESALVAAEGCGCGAAESDHTEYAEPEHRELCEGREALDDEAVSAPSAGLVESVDEAMEQGIVLRSQDGLIAHVVSRAGGHSLPTFRSVNPYSPAVIFDAYTAGRAPALHPHYERIFDLVAAPGQVAFGVVQPGDIVIRRALGEGNLAHAFLIASGEAHASHALHAAGLRAADRRPGIYVQVIEAFPALRGSAAGHARLLAGPGGRLGRDTLVLRLRAESALAENLAEDLAEDAYSPTGGRTYQPVAATFQCAPDPPAVTPATQLPAATQDPDAATRAVITQLGVTGARATAFTRGGGLEALRPIAGRFGAAALAELIARLRYRPEQLADPPHGYDGNVARTLGVRGTPALLAPRLLLAIPGHFRELARLAPNAREAHALESLGWLIMASVRDEMAVAGHNWWIPPAPAFVGPFANPLPPLSPAVQSIILRAGLIDTTLSYGDYNARFTAWENGLACRAWRLETGAEPSAAGPGRPFYPQLVALPQAVNITTQRTEMQRLWRERLARTDANPQTPPLSDAATQALRTCDNAPLDQLLAYASLQGLAMSTRFPMRVADRTVISRLRVMAAIQPVFEQVFATIQALGWNDLLFNTEGAACFRGQKVPVSATDPQRHRRAARQLSEHGLGAAADFNAFENRQTGNGPRGSMDPRIVALFEAFHFTWGGCFTTPDPMHFEY